MNSSKPSRRGLLAGAGAGALGLTTPSCGGGGFSSDEDTSGENPTLRMLVNITSNLSKSFWRELVAPFEDANDVTVRIDAPTGEGVKDTLPQLLAADDAPDIVETLMVDETLAPQMLDLSDQDWTSDTPLVEEATLDGAIYTVGVGSQAQSLVYYNKAAFDDAGIDALPENLDELTAAMAELKAAGYLPLQTAGDYVTGLQFQQLVWPSLIGAEPEWYQQVAAGNIGVGESLLPFLELYAAWLDEAYIDDQALGLNDADAQTAFFAGESAMYVMGSWLVSTEAETDTEADVGVFAAPTRAGQPYPGPMGATMAMPYMILESSPNADLARRLIEWLVTDRDPILQALEQDGNFRTGHDWCETSVCTEVSELLAEAPSLTPQGEGYGDLTLPSGFETELNELVQGLYVGSSPSEVARDLDAWMDTNA